MFGRRLNCNQARMCVSGVSANRVWLVSLFLNFYLAVIGSCRAGIVDIHNANQQRNYWQIYGYIYIYIYIYIYMEVIIITLQ